MSNNVAKKEALNKVTHSVRASQAVLQYGVGAMVDFPDQTLMTAAQEYWATEVQKIHDERLEKALGVHYFGMPKGADETTYGISYVRFPEWYFCPRCRKFMPIEEWRKEYLRIAPSKLSEGDPYMLRHMRCPTCKQELVVSRIVVACKDGHIDDFPWIKWVHSRSMGGRKKICSNPVLEFMTSPSAKEGLEGITIRCKTCGATATLRGAFNSGVFEELDKKTDYEYDFKCTGRHPWKNSRSECEEYPLVLQRGSSSVYFPVIESSLVIPPYSDQVTVLVESSKEFDTLRNSINDVKSTKVEGQPEDVVEAIKKSQISQLVESYGERITKEIPGVSIKDVMHVLERKFDDSKIIATPSSIDYKYEEYTALSGKIKVGTGISKDFSRLETNIDDYALPCVKQISLIEKIREVQVLLGYTRLAPSSKDSEEFLAGNIVQIKGGNTDWYPGYEVRGEGIFVEFDNEAIASWLEKNTDIKRRVDALNNNYRTSFIGSKSPRKITGEFVLLHTISHLLIKQLSFECGYSVASLKERIYCCDDAEKKMSGILIYTASGDSEGTLGGLVRQGHHDTFPTIFRKAIETARFCSNDPVCSMSLGQGRESLNLAACYSCCLLPETSCEEYNVFLDRGAVVGTFDNPDMGFYAHQIKNGWDIDMKKSEAMNSNISRAVTIKIIEKQSFEQTYREVWEGLAEYADEDERKILNKLAELSDSIPKNAEIPGCSCKFMVEGEQRTYICDLVWEKTKTMFFTKEHEEEYMLAQKSEWTCFFSGDKALTVAKIIDAISK